MDRHEKHIYAASLPNQEHEISTQKKRKRRESICRCNFNCEKRSPALDIKTPKAVHLTVQQLLKFSSSKNIQRNPRTHVLCSMVASPRHREIINRAFEEAKIDLYPWMSLGSSAWSRASTTKNTWDRFDQRKRNANAKYSAATLTANYRGVQLWIPKHPNLPPSRSAIFSQVFPPRNQANSKPPKNTQEHSKTPHHTQLTLTTTWAPPPPEPPPAAAAGWRPRRGAWRRRPRVVPVAETPGTGSPPPPPQRRGARAGWSGPRPCPGEAPLEAEEEAGGGRRWQWSGGGELGLWPPWPAFIERDGWGWSDPPPSDRIWTAVMSFVCLCGCGRTAPCAVDGLWTVGSCVGWLRWCKDE